MLKIGPSGGTGFGPAWDHESKTEIAQLIISRSATCINYIHFVYVEDGGNKLVMSEKIGSGYGGSISLNTVRIKNRRYKKTDQKSPRIKSNDILTIMLDYPHEVITGVTGKYYVEYCKRRQLMSLTFFTNKCKYGPFEVSKPSKAQSEIEEIRAFDYHVGDKQFGGFFGTSSNDGIESIGIYLKPLGKLPFISSIKTE